MRVDDTPAPRGYEEIGIGKSLANRARRLSEIPEESFGEMIQDRREQATQKVTKAVERSLSTNAILREARKTQKGDREPKFSSIIKPSDNWNFSTVQYPRIDEGGANG